ncbi:MAG TPA: hypothetical protein VNB22_12535, partial [Pyrinomonadaceae bacterium]|nr:hypothetical protein [Pyrinomonadaceae bacterium]
MSKNKLKALLVFFLAAGISGLINIPSASAQSTENLPVFEAFLLRPDTDTPGFLLFPKALNQDEWKNAPDYSVRINGGGGEISVLTVTDPAGCDANQKTWDGGGATNNWSEAANWTCDALPTASDTVIFDGTSAKAATVDIDLNLNILNIRAGYAGTLAQGVSSVTLNGTFTQAGGTFDGGSGATVFNNSFEQTGGTFNASVGTTTVVGGVFKREAGGAFNHRNGTFVFAGNSVQVVIVSGATATQDFGNLAINTPGGLFGSENDTLRVSGSLNLNNGAIFSIIVEALGAVTVADTFGNGTANVGEGRILFSGATNRVVNLPILAGSYNAIELNAPNTTVNLMGAGEIRLKQLFVKDGFFNAGTSNLKLNVNGTASSVSGGVLDCGSGVVTFDFGTFAQTGGTVDCQNATINSTPAAGLQLLLSGGVFNAPVGTMTFNGGVFERGANGTFNHNNGTVIFAGNTVEVRIVNGVTALQEFGNLTVATSGGLFGSDNDPLRVKGNLSLSGQAFSVNFEAQGNVSVPSGFSTNTSTHLSFTGSGNQTFTNGGGANAAGNWTINKPAGTVTALTSLILAPSQPFNITSGTLYLNENSNLTVGALVLGASGKLVNESSTIITLGGNLINNCLIDLQGGGAGCPENDTILIRSSDAAQRAWSGGGRYRLVDVDVQNMGGSGTKTVFSGTNSGNNNSSWIFNANCPAALSITPSSATVQAGGTQTFTAGGGFVPY